MTNQIVFVNGKSKCGCVMEFSDGGGEYSDVHYITPCAAHSQAETTSQPVGYFAYDTDGGFTNHDTAERAQTEAQNAIEYFRESAGDGWSDEVDSVCWGVIMQQAEQTDVRPRTEEDKCESHIEEICDYMLQPKVSATTGITVKVGE
ncbi:hypothetical protein [Kluyvera sp. Awk 3]|uniref:hypothetical protein n=1 Tax=Kluyvera sp. Awk 3 TaxID=2963956 RepID=UPI0023020B0B|nr:hypothetical protein [Kluyvera sp. Awk 3]MDA8487454.1 hypothetical protein [Kluyvera sp. Awk 3]